jgi:uncharacterized membrane protein YfcA
MFLEIAATAGALGGAYIAGLISPAWVAIIFGLVLLHSAYLTITSKGDGAGNGKTDWIASRLQLNGSYPTPHGEHEYHVRSVPGGFLFMVVAGILAGLLGIGSGALKVIAMDRLMRIPFKVSTATSNFMIGVTAAASAGIYLKRGYIDPGLAMPVMLGVLCGSMIGGRFLSNAKTKLLKNIFAATIIVLGIQMIYKGIMEKF